MAMTIEQWMEKVGIEYEAQTKIRDEVHVLEMQHREKINEMWKEYDGHQAEIRRLVQVEMKQLTDRA